MSRQWWDGSPDPIERYEAARQLFINATGADPRDVPSLNFSAQHDGSAHIEAHRGKYSWIVTERGKEFERRTTRDPEELLYWLVESAASAAAGQWELQHRRGGEDHRRQSFAKQLELLAMVSREFARLAEIELRGVLREYPFNDPKCAKCLSDRTWVDAAAPCPECGATQTTTLP